MAKKAGKSSSPVRVVKLGPSQMATEAPAGQDFRWARVTVGPDGVLSDAPVRLQVCTGDVIAWLVTNQSGKALKLKLKDFKRKGGRKTIAPITWMHEHCSVPNGGVGLVVGCVSHEVGPKAEVDHVKYTIEVRGPGAIDYDPDLEIRRPSL